MMVLSDAIKNLFGVIPGLQKLELHCLNPDPESFAAHALMEESEVVGEWTRPDHGFALPKSVSVDFVSIFPQSLRGPIRSFLDRALVAMPRVKKKTCIGYGKCAESCPQHIISLVEKKAVIDRQSCISCFCCQEMCPVKAIKTVRRIKG